MFAFSRSSYQFPRNLRVTPGYAHKDAERTLSAAKLALEARFGREHRLFAIDSEQDGV